MAIDPLLAEIDDDLRRENMRKLWRAVGSYIIAITGLILIGTVAIVAWQSYQDRQAERLTAQLLEAREMATNGRVVEALAQLDAVVGEQHRTLSLLAQLWAAQLAARDSKEQSQAYLQPLLNAPSNKDPYHHFAHLLAAGDSGHDDEIMKGPFAPTAREIRAFENLRQNRPQEAAALYRRLAEEAGAPETLRGRAQLMLSTVLAGVTPVESANPAPEQP